MKITARIAAARAEACGEAAEHLNMSWTDDPTERDAGRYVQSLLLRERSKWDSKALVLERGEKARRG